MQAMPVAHETSTLSLDRFEAEARAAVVAAQTQADERRHAEVQPLHLLFALLLRSGVTRVIERMGIDRAELTAAVDRALSLLPHSVEPAYFSVSLLELIGRAEREAKREQRSQTTLEDLLNVLAQELRPPLGEVLAAFGISPGAFRPHLGALGAGRREPALPALGPAPTNEEPSGYTTDLRRAAELPLIGRASELRRVLTVLERHGKSHPLLVGEAGVGKRSIVSALGARLARGDVPRGLQQARLLRLEFAALSAGARLRGELEERVRSTLARLTSESTPLILFIPNLEQIFGAQSALSGLPDLLRLGLERARFRLLGTVTPEGLRKLEDRDPALLRWLSALDIGEPSVDEAVDMVRSVSGYLETHHRVNITEAAVLSAPQLAKRYLQDRRLPEGAIDLLDEAAARCRVARDGLSEQADAEVRRLEAIDAQLASAHDPDDGDLEPLRQRLLGERTTLAPRVEQALKARDARSSEPSAVLPRVTAEDVATTLAAWTGIPAQRLLEGEAEKLLDLEGRLTQRVVGQDHAVAAVARAVRRGRVGLRDPRRPIGSFLFLGPSGVGKTELAKALAALLFDDERSLIRLDMSEFMERHMAQRLIGAPPGYADSEQGGFLTEAVRRRPYSVLLFDEVEKAHQDVFNLLLQLLDEGRLTDGRGRTTDFSNTVVIFTSNLGSERILGVDPASFDTDAGRLALRTDLLENLRQFFRPELLNRIDEVQVFRPLSKQHLSLVVDIELAKVAKLLEAQRLRLNVDPSVKAQLVELGYEPALGARPLRRVILRELQDPLAEALLAGRFGAGQVVNVDLVDGALRLRAV